MADEYWFLALNGPSCAMSAFPLRKPFDVFPRPEFLIGFEDEEEARRYQQLFLTCPPEDLPKHGAMLRARPDVIILSVEDSEPRTTGQTVWVQH